MQVVHSFQDLIHVEIKFRKKNLLSVGILKSLKILKRMKKNPLRSYIHQGDKPRRDRLFLADGIKSSETDNSHRRNAIPTLFFSPFPLSFSLSDALEKSRRESRLHQRRYNVTQDFDKLIGSTRVDLLRGTRAKRQKEKKKKRNNQRSRSLNGERGNRRKERSRRVDDARSVCFVSAGGAMIDDAVNDILLDRHFRGSIETTFLNTPFTIIARLITRLICRPTSLSNAFSYTTKSPDAHTPFVSDKLHRLTSKNIETRIRRECILRNVIQLALITGFF
ncbi:hypothetical protein PUN28_019053 [Cardiocondyla obscurior]|uniref:Uncharacterized protein n=1 Tax=Cardiocondyla obscurior TaxID=286306 RepID=A0AAW2ED60_9HYME